jgi:hypothetical protein
MQTTHLYTQFVATLLLSSPLSQSALLGVATKLLRKMKKLMRRVIGMLNSQLVSHPNPEEGLLDLRSWGKPLSSGLIERV